MQGLRGKSRPFQPAGYSGCMTLRTVASEGEFDDLLAGGKPVLALFTAIWSAPSQRLVPVFEEITAELGNAVEAITVDVDDTSWEDSRLEVGNVPTLLLLRDEKILMRTSGEKGRDELLDKVRKALVE